MVISPIAFSLSESVRLFCLQCACGISLILLTLSTTEVDAGFFRKRLYLIFGLAVCAAVISPAGRWLSVGIAALSFADSALWLFGHLKSARLLLTVLAALTIVSILRYGSGWQEEITRICSALVVGVHLVAMLLGHEYLVWPGMALNPLKRLLILLLMIIALRGALSLVGTVNWWTHPLDFSTDLVSPHLTTGLVLARLLAGIVGPLILGMMAWQTANIGSTQSATGILYAAVALTLFGELSAQLLSQQLGILL